VLAVFSCLTGLYGRGCRLITLDVAALDFVDASGLRVLVHALKRALALGGQVVLRHRGRQVERVLDLRN